jgi:hypothetical protein
MNASRAAAQLIVLLRGRPPVLRVVDAIVGKFPQLTPRSTPEAFKSIYSHDLFRKPTFMKTMKTLGNQRTYKKRQKKWLPWYTPEGKTR